MWQVLPLGPTGYGNSPYSARSSFAGNPLLISCEMLHEQGYVTDEQLRELSGEDESGTVNYEAAGQLKLPILRKAAQRFLRKQSDSEQLLSFKSFCDEHTDWLDDYALFSSLCDHYGDSRWYEVWDRDIGFREEGAIEHWSSKLFTQIMIRKVLQYFFFTQWKALKTYVNDLGIEIIGDIPMFTAGDSADVWSHTRLFKTDAQGKFSFLSGVPPDFFSDTGQLWGTPVYDWDVHIKDGFSWWLKRIEAALRLTDVVRIDHFRGFSACWEIPAGSKTAETGTWVEAPGAKLFETMRSAWGEVPVIAEDLGVITPDVEQLRDSNGLPGMKIFQFAFDYKAAGKLNADNAFLPHNYEVNCVAYTGTHDNDTTAGWYEQLSEDYRDLVRRYLACDDKDVVWAMIRTLMQSAARYVVIPMQDLHELPGTCRMNKPSTVGASNWSWRLLSHQLSERTAHRFRELVELYGRDAT
jgi:4-alpha-glucanotransferase